MPATTEMKSQSEPNNSATPSRPAETSMARAHEHAERAFSLMKQHEVVPIPEHYAVFYHYAVGMHTALVKEMDQAIASKLPFSLHFLSNLYHRYIVSNANEQVLHEVTQGTSKALSEVVRIVGEFSRETSAYNQNIDDYVRKMSMDIPDPALQNVVKELINNTLSMKQRGEALTIKLDESRNEVTSLRSNIEQLREESQRDFLTGVLNRKALDRALEDQLTQHASGNRELALLMLDVDHFKNFNDKYGHLLGDEVLKIVARAITYSVRGKDIIARYGGEEFCVVLPDTPILGAVKVAETIRQTIANRDLKRKDTGESFGHVTVSVGVAQFRPRTDTMETLVRRADDALYKSKHVGRNKVTPEWEVD